MTSEPRDDGGVREIERRLAAAFPLDAVVSPAEDVVLGRVPAVHTESARLGRVMAAMSSLVAALALAAIVLAVMPPIRSMPSNRPAMASSTSSESPDVNSYVNYAPPPPFAGQQIAVPLRQTRDPAVASRAVAFKVLLPADPLGEHLDYIEIPPTDATSTGTWGAIIHYGGVHYEGIYMTEFPSSSEASAAEEVSHEPTVLGFDDRWDYWVDVNGHRAYANSKSHLEAPGGRVMPVSQVMWNDGRFVYRLQSETLTYEQLLVIARSVPSR